MKEKFIAKARQADDEAGTEITQITSPFITNVENLLGPIYGA
jgi:hypothetical protein